MARAAVVWLALLAACGGAAASRPPPLRPAACWFAPVPGAKVDCARLAVRERPGGRTIELAVAVFHSRSAHPRPDPVLFLTGGPGGAGIALVRAVFSAYGAPFLRERDLVVLDPRGTGWSSPSLTCRADETQVDCLLRWRRAGVDLGAYRSAAAADDVEALRRALGIERWNVFGLSYGTRLALTLLRDHPGHVRSAVLDSVVAPQLDEIATATPNAARAIQRLLDRARTAYPDLATALRDAVERLGRRPLGGRLDGADLLHLTYEALYEARWIPLLPRAIEAARAGRLDPLWARVEEVGRQIRSIVAAAAHDAWICNEQVPFTSRARVAAADERYAVAPAFSQAGMLDVCAAAGLGSRAPAVENRAVESAVPALLLTGRFDPVSPVEQARAAARTLRRGRVVVFPTLAHGVFAQSACVRRIALGFLDAPLRAPDASCIGRIPPVAWAR